MENKSLILFLTFVFFISFLTVLNFLSIDVGFAKDKNRCNGTTCGGSNDQGRFCNDDQDCWGTMCSGVTCVLNPDDETRICNLSLNDPPPNPRCPGSMCSGTSCVEGPYATRACEPGDVDEEGKHRVCKDTHDFEEDAPGKAAFYFIVYDPQDGDKYCPGTLNSNGRSYWTGCTNSTGVLVPINWSLKNELGTIISSGVFYPGVNLLWNTSMSVPDSASCENLTLKFDWKIPIYIKGGGPNPYRYETGQVEIPLNSTQSTCGEATSQTADPEEAPSSNLCETGTTGTAPFWVPMSQTWRWSCSSCNECISWCNMQPWTNPYPRTNPYPTVNGQCASPVCPTSITQANGCISGSISSVTPIQSPAGWTWTCNGTGVPPGTNSSTCTAYQGSNGLCNTTTTSTIFTEGSAPSTNSLCSFYTTAPSLSGGHTSYWSWNCNVDPSCGTSKSCWAPVKGWCEPEITEKEWNSAPPLDELCKEGTAIVHDSNCNGAIPCLKTSDDHSNDRWVWKCKGYRNTSDAESTITDDDITQACDAPKTYVFPIPQITVVDAGASGGIYCDGASRQSFVWTYTDLNSTKTSQTHYQIQVATNENFSSIAHDSGMTSKLATSGSSNYITLNIGDSSTLNFGHTQANPYYWKVRARNNRAPEVCSSCCTSNFDCDNGSICSQGNCQIKTCNTSDSSSECSSQNGGNGGICVVETISGVTTKQCRVDTTAWSDINTFTTPLHAYPQVTLNNWSLIAYTKKEISLPVTVIGAEPFTFKWYLNGVLDAAQTTNTYKHTFASKGSNTIKVIVCDKDNYCCPKEASILIKDQLPLPLWKEVSPF